MDKSYKTAIARKTLSVPTRMLRDKGLLKGRVLDYGCGRSFDTDHLNIDGYDPHYSPRWPVGKYDTIICNYVLNVVEGSTQDDIIYNIRNLLTLGGTAYITVRRDIKTEGVTSRGTYQTNVTLSFEILRETSKYCTYIIQ